MAKEYDNTNALSIFKYSGKLIHHTLADVIPRIYPNIRYEDLDQDGKGGLGVLVEK